jgi:hypothetical protein
MSTSTLTATYAAGAEDVHTVHASPLADVLGHHGRSVALVVDYSTALSLVALLETGRYLLPSDRTRLSDLAAKIQASFDAKH